MLQTAPNRPGQHCRGCTQWYTAASSAIACVCLSSSKASTLYCHRLSTCRKQRSSCRKQRGLSVADQLPPHGRARRERREAAAAAAADASGSPSSGTASPPLSPPSPLPQAAPWRAAAPADEESGARAPAGPVTAGRPDIPGILAEVCGLAGDGAEVGVMAAGAHPEPAPCFASKRGTHLCPMCA